MSLNSENEGFDWVAVMSPVNGADMGRYAVNKNGKITIEDREGRRLITYTKANGDNEQLARTILEKTH